MLHNVDAIFDATFRIELISISTLNAGDPPPPHRGSILISIPTLNAGDPPPPHRGSIGLYYESTL